MDFLAGLLIGSGATMLMRLLFSSCFEDAIGSQIARDARLFDMSEPSTDRTDFTA